MKNILLIQTAFIGDLILTTPLFSEIKKIYPNSKLTVIVNSGYQSILSENPYTDSIIPLDKKKIKKSLFEFIKFLKFIRSQKFDICISSHFSYRSSLISFFSGAKERIGYEQSGFSFLHNHKIDRPLLGKHEVDKLFSLLYKSESEYPQIKRPQIYFSESENQDYQLLLERLKLNYHRYIVIAPSSMWETKKMPVYKFMELIGYIESKTDYICVLVGSKSDIQVCNDVAQIFKKKSLNLAGQTTLKELSYLINRSDLVISNDSSPIHIASAFNIPCIAIFGATVPDFGYTPLSEKQYIAQVENLDCRPCGIHGSDRCPQGHFSCMLKQDTKKIFEQIKNLV